MKLEDTMIYPDDYSWEEVLQHRKDCTSVRAKLWKLGRSADFYRSEEEESEEEELEEEESEEEDEEAV